MVDKFNINRDRLAAFIPDNDTIRRFEKLFQAVTDTTPANLTIIFSRLDELLIDVASAQGGSVAASDAISALARSIESMVSAPRFAMPRSFPVDYMDFDQQQPYVPQTARIGWSATDDTLNIQHSDGVSQQVGQELYGRITNNTGSTILNGTALGIDPTTNSFVKFIANGTIPPVTIVGVTTQDILNGAQGRITVWGRVHDLNTTGSPYGETWTAGQILYVSTTIAGGFTHIKPTAPNLSIPIAQVLVVDAVVGQIAVRPTVEQQLFYGAFTRNTNQTAGAINTAQNIVFDTTEDSSGITIGSPASRIVAASSGLYKFSASFRTTSTAIGATNVYFWFRKNGVDIARTGMVVSLAALGDIATTSRSLHVSMAAGDYVELMFAVTNINARLEAVAATAFSPAAPAVALTVDQVQQ